MFGDRLKRLRQEKGLTQEQMREIIIALLIEKGYSEEDATFSLNTYRNWEQNVSIANSKYLSVIAPFLGTTTDYLLDVNQEEPDDEDGGHYYGKDTIRLARAISADRNLAMMLDAARQSTPEAIQLAHQMLSAMKRKEVGDDEGIDQTRKDDDLDG